jgi:V/A-type H+-transporting ATPase subunit D
MRFQAEMKNFMEQRNITRNKILEAYKLLNYAYMYYGKSRVKFQSEFNRIHYEPNIHITNYNYIGVDTVKIKLDILEKQKLPSYSFQDTPIVFDDLIEKIKDSMEEIVKLAELNYLSFHFAFNYRKIKRRINALDNLIIPRLSNDINNLEEILDELEREELIRLKQIKNNIIIDHKSE